MPQILTAGYGNLGFDSFVARVQSLRVTHLVDVRAIPWSSYYVEFRREELVDRIPPTGLKYVYMGDTLGGVKDSAALCKQPGAIEPAPLFERPELKLGIAKLMAAAIDEEKAICLMCGCLRAEKCHRSWLLGEVLTSAGATVLHVDAEGSLQTQQVVMALREPDQASLF